MARTMVRLCMKVLFAAGMSSGTMLAYAQTGTGSASADVVRPSKIDAFLGYSYFATSSALQPSGVPFDPIAAGGSASITYYLTRHLGVETLFGAHEGGFNSLTQQIYPNDSVFFLTAGPTYRQRVNNRWVVFGHVLLGAGDLLGPNSDVQTSFTHNDYRWGFAETVGGGVDYVLPLWHNRLSIRAVQLDYQHMKADFGPYHPAPTPGQGGGAVGLNGLGISAGVVAHFGRR